MKFCAKLSKMAAEIHQMLKAAFGGNALGQTQTYEWFKISRMDGCQSMMTSVQDKPSTTTTTEHVARV
jgi:hypothetical protein